MTHPPDFEIIGVESLWRFSKRRSYRAAVTLALESLAKFLQENALVNRELLSSGQSVSGDFRIMRSDLTDEGFEFYQQAEQRWLGAIERGTAPADTRPLEAVLREMRGSSALSG